MIGRQGMGRILTGKKLCQRSQRTTAFQSNINILCTTAVIVFKQIWSSKHVEKLVEKK